MAAKDALACALLAEADLMLFVVRVRRQFKRARIMVRSVLWSPDT